MTYAKLQASYDVGIKVDSVKIYNKGTGSSQTYCLGKTVGGKEAHSTRGASLRSSGNVLEVGGCL